MKTVRGAAPNMASIDPYDPKSLPADVFVSANESPYDMPEAVQNAIVERIAQTNLNRYPDPMANDLRDLIASVHGVKRENILCGNGGDEVLFDLMLAWGGPGRKIMVFPPTFSIYELNAQLTYTDVVRIPRVGSDYHVDTDAACERLAQGDIDVVVITSPNNPTGCCTPAADVRRILEATDALVLVDEAYIEFSPNKSVHGLLNEFGNLLILHTFSKAYASAGVRLGYFVGAQEVITEFTKVRQAYSVDSMSQIVGEEVIKARESFEPQIDALRRGRIKLAAQLEAIEGVEVHPSDANFILITVANAKQVWDRMYRRHSVLVRNVSGDPLLPDCLRITVGTPQENEAVIKALQAEL